MWSMGVVTGHVIHTHFPRRPSVMSLSFQSNWLYVGMEGGNVHMVDVKEFVVSGYTIYWDKVTIHDT